MATVQLQGVIKSFGATEVIKGVDLTIEDQEFVVFVGPSGCGKTTLLRLIAGLEGITSGDLLIDGGVAAAAPAICWPRTRSTSIFPASNGSAGTGHGNWQRRRMRRPPDCEKRWSSGEDAHWWNSPSYRLLLQKYTDWKKCGSARTSRGLRRICSWAGTPN